MTAKKAEGVRIAIGGKYLDEAQIRQAKPYQPGMVSFLSFPASRHRAIVEKEQVTISAQAPSVVQLYATGVIPPIRGRPVALAVDGADLGEWVLDAVESAESSGVYDVIVLKFRRSDQGTP